MGTRGRKSKHDVSVSPVRGTDKGSRPPPPASLNEDQTALWLAIVNELPPGALSAYQLPLLEAYVQHVTQLRKVGSWLTMCGEHDEATIDDFDKLLRMQEKVTRTMASLSVRLGFGKTHESVYEGKQDSPSVKPWE